MKTKILALLTLIIGCVSVFAGCTNPYKNLKINLSETQVEIELKNNVSEIDPVIVTASVSGVGKKVSKKLIVTTQNNCISLSTEENENGETEISILPISTATEKSALITVASQEGGKTATISVTLINKPTEMFVNESYKPAVSINGKLQLNGDLAVNYGANSDDVTEKDVTFSLAGEYAGVSLTETGLLSVGSEKPANSEIMIEVKNVATSLSKQFPVRVIKPLTSTDQITTKLDGEVVEDVIIRLNQNAKPLLTFETSETAEEYEFKISANKVSLYGELKDIVDILKLNSSSFELSGLIAGQTTLNVTCFVSGYEGYAPFIFEMPLKNVFVPTDVLINNSNQKNQELSLFTAYTNGLFGTAVKLSVYPSGVEEENSYIKISSESEHFAKIKWFYSDETEITDLSNIPSGVTIYANLNNVENINELNNMEIVFSSSNFEDVCNTMVVKTYQSIESASVENLTEISTSTEQKEDVLMIMNGASTTLSLVLKDSLGAEIALENTDLSAYVLDGKNYVTVQKTTITENETEKQVFVINGIGEGEANIKLSSQNGFTYTFKAKVFNPINADEIRLSVPTIKGSSSVAYLKTNESNEEGTFEFNKENIEITYKLFQNKNVNIAFIKNNNATTIEKFTTIKNDYSCCQISSTGLISTNSFVKDKNTATLSATIIGWFMQEDVCTEVEVTYTIDLTVVEGILNVSIEFDEGYSNIVYLAESVGKLYPELSKTSMSVQLTESIFNAISSENEDKVNVYWSIAGIPIDWVEAQEPIQPLDESEQPDESEVYSSTVVPGIKKIKATKQNNILSLSFETLDVYENGFPPELQITLSFSQYGRTIEFTEHVKFIRAETVTGITISNLKSYTGTSSSGNLKYQMYFDARNGLNLQNTEFDNQVNTIKINATANPNTALNKKLRYFSSDENIAKVDEFSGIVMPIGAGDCFIYVVSEDSVTSASLNEENVLIVDRESTMIYPNNPQADIKVAIKVYVADGTKDNPFEINTAQELCDINASAENLSYFYVLNNHINLGNTNFTPIGSLKQNNIELGFSGGISGGREGYSFTISNLTINSASENIGFVSTLNSGAELARINLINFNISSASAINVGALAGVNNGTIAGTYVHWTENQQNATGTEFVTSFNYENFDLNGTISASNLANVGGVAGVNAGKIENVSVHCVPTKNDGGISGVVVGGIAGENQSQITNCLVNAILSGDKAGGIAGKNSENATISKGFVEIYNENETITGTNITGGIVGENTGIITLSYIRNFVKDSNLTEISGTNIGAFVGLNSGTISETYAMLNMNISATGENTGTLTDYFVNETKFVTNADKWNTAQTELKFNPVEKVPESLTLQLNAQPNFIIYEELNNTFIAYLQSIGGVANKNDNLYNLSELLTITPTPTINHLQLVAQSSNTSVVAIVLTENGAMLKLNSAGKATITLTALKNKTVTCSFDIYVINGVGSIDYSSTAFNSDKNILTIEKYQTVKINATATFNGFDANQNIKYELSLSESELESYGLTFDATNLTFKATKECEVNITLIPYIQIAENIKHYISKTHTFTIKCTERANLISVSKTGESIYPIDETSFTVTMLTTKDIVNSSDAETLEYAITGKNDILSVNETAGTASTVEINQNTYYQVTYTYSIQINNNKKATISQNENFEFKFYSSLWENDEEIKVYAIYNLTVIPQKLINISAQHFPTGVGPYKQGDSENPKEPEPSSDIIIPGEVGILQLDLYPTYAKMQNIYISSTTAGGDKLTFEQVEYVEKKKLNNETNEMEATGFYELKKVYPLPIYQPDGSISLTIKENVSIYYLRTYIGSNISEGTTFTVTITGKGIANNENIIRSFDFTVQNKAETTITPVENIAYVGEYKGGKSVFVAGLDAEINFNQIRFNNENIDVKVYEYKYSEEQENYIYETTSDISLVRKTDEKGNFVSSINGNTATYPYEIIYGDSLKDNSGKLDFSKLYGKTYKVKFTVIANVNGLTETKEVEKEIMFVKEKLTNFEIEPLSTEKHDNYSHIAYGGARTYRIIATYYSADYSEGDRIESDDNNSKIKDLISADYISVADSSVVDLNINNDGTFTISGLKITESTSVSLNAYYYYSSGSFVVTSESDDGWKGISYTLGLYVRATTSDDNPYPIYTEEEFIEKLSEELEKPLDYILMNDINLSDYTPINFNAKSLDGNGRVITINKFDASSFYSEGFAKDSIALGLFNEIGENSVLKNVTLNVADSRVVNNNEDSTLTDKTQPSTNLTMFSNVNVALFAVTNNGIINNCRVGNYVGKIGLGTDFSTSDSPFEENLDFKTADDGTNFPVNTHTFTTANTSVADANFSLFVGTNNGYISNSHVNGINNAKSTNWESVLGEHTFARLCLVANGNLAGFANINNGAISSSYAKAIKLENTSSYIAETKTSGFVIENAGGARIMYSYIMGFGSYERDSSPLNIADKLYHPSINGKALLTNGNGAGFVFNNNGIIKESYANISIEGIKAQSGGFVYSNSRSGTIENCVSFSKITPNSTKNSLFSAINNLNQSLNAGKIKLCYTHDQSNNLSSITDVEAGIKILNKYEFAENVSYSFDTISAGANWGMDSAYGPYLKIANQEYSRVRTVNDSNTPQAPTEDPTNQYSYLEIDGGANGASVTKPYLIYSAESYNDFIELITAKKPADYSSYHAILVKDITFENEEIDSQSLDFKGTFNGNGFDIENISLVTNEASSSAPNNFGFFATTTDYLINNNSRQSIIKNTNFEVTEVTATKSYCVGAVAGSMQNTNLFDIFVIGETESAVTGRNFVGGIAGYIQNVNAFNCVNNGVSVSSEYAHGSITEIWEPDNEKYFSLQNDADEKQNDADKNKDDFKTYSYAGGLFGVVKGSKIEKLTTQNKAVIKGENAGGLVGYLSNNSTLTDAEFIAIWNQQPTDFSQGIYGTRNAGAIAAHSAGTIEFARLDCADESKELADSTTAQITSANTHISNLFAKVNYRTGALIGYMVGGELKNSYSRIDVRNRNAHIAGGLVGEATAGTISICYTTSSVYAYLTLNEEIASIAPRIGGIIGLSSAGGIEIQNTFAFNKWKNDSFTNVTFNELYNGTISSKSSGIYGVKNSDADSTSLHSFQEYIENTNNYRTKAFSAFNSTNWNKTSIFPRLVIYNHNTYQP